MGVFWEGCCYGHSQKGGVSGWSKRRVVLGVVLGGIVRRSARGRVRRAVLGMESVKSRVRGGFREGH